MGPWDVHCLNRRFCPHNASIMFQWFLCFPHDTLQDRIDREVWTQNVKLLVNFVTFKLFMALSMCLEGTSNHFDSSY